MRRLGLFAKFWEPGQVKSRLAATVGTEKACLIYQTFLFHLVSKLQSVGTVREIVYSPSSKRDAFRSAIPDTWALHPQISGGLGERMRQYFLDCFQPNTERKSDASTTKQPEKLALIIGADIPQLEPDEINNAFRHLHSNDVVVGPSVDGGYYLLGMKNQAFDLFKGIAWSRPDVLTRTLDHLSQMNLSFHLLPPRNDVDEISDLDQLFVHLKSSNLPHLIQLRTKLQRILSDRAR